MKKFIIAIVFFPVSVAMAAAPENSKVFTPYFDMSLTQSGYIPSNGNIFSGSLIDTKAGFLIAPAEKHSVFSLYSFNYSGPGFNPQDTRQFSERSMDHSLNLEYRYEISDTFRIRPAFNFGNSYRRAGTNESWENGLYNSNSKGFQLSVDYTFDSDRNGLVVFSALSRKIKFPNYTDLLNEFQNPQANAEVSGGLYDQTLNNYFLRPSWNNFFGSISYTSQNYDKQKVIELSGVYGNRKQKDSEISAEVGMKQELWVFDIYPSLIYTKHKSNQNFIRYKFIGDTSPYPVKNAYSYGELSFVMPVDLKMTSKWAIGGSLSVTKRTYDSRPPRDENNEYMSGDKQSNTFKVATVSMRKMINEMAYVRLFYSITKASSNNKFEAYMPYNYTGSSFGLTYGINY